MKKVCILSTVDLTRMTLLTLYTDYLEEKGISYDIIHVDKYDEDIVTGANRTFRFNPNTKDNWTMLRKLLKFWKMRKFALDIMVKNKYDFIIVWNELTTFIFSDILRKEFNGKYCINIRDYQFNNLFLVKKRLKEAIQSSAFSTVSSPAFIRFLPKHKYIIIHSLNRKILNSLDPHCTLKKKDEPIKILNIGQIRWLENVYYLIDQLGNDSRFELIFAGTGAEAVGEYIKGKNINNVFWYGRFKPSETSNFLKQADIIYNLYGIGNKHVDTALSIKLYYAVYLNIPILVYKNTFMAEIAEKYGIGFLVKKCGEEGLGNSLYNWYHSQNQQVITDNCNMFIRDINEGYDMLKCKMEEFGL